MELGFTMIEKSNFSRQQKKIRENRRFTSCDANVNIVN